MQHFEVRARTIDSDPLGFGCMHMMSPLGFGRLGGGIAGCWLAVSVSPTRCSDGKAMSGSYQKIKVVVTLDFMVPKSLHLIEIVINNVRL